MEISGTEEKPQSAESCLFTGHREIGKDFSKKKLCAAIDECISLGCRTFYCGMAKGFDLLAGQEIVKRKKEGQPLKIVACIPFRGQANSYAMHELKVYNEILNAADETHVLFETYTKWCMSERNKFMADRSDIAIAYLNTDKGGTFNTVKYFCKKKKGYVYYCNE